MIRACGTLLLLTSTLRAFALSCNKYRCLSTPCKKFNIVRNDHGHTQIYELSALDRKHHFSANLVQKIKIVSLCWNLVFRPIKICSIYFFCFWPEIPFLGKFDSKSQNFQFKLKFGTSTNSNIHNSMVVFNFSVLDWEYHFWANLVQKVKIVNSNWNLVLRLIQVWRIQWWCSFFPFLTGRFLFWDKFVPKNQNCLLKLKYGT